MNKITYVFDVSRHAKKTITFSSRRIGASEVIAKIKEQNPAMMNDELHLFDLQTKEEYHCSDRITPNMSLIVKRRQKANKSMNPISTKRKEKKIVVDDSEIKKEEEETERKMLTCQCGNLFVDAFFVTCCGKSICKNCFDKSKCPFCGNELNSDNCRPNPTLRDKVNNFLKKYPQVEEPTPDTHETPKDSHDVVEKKD